MAKGLGHLTMTLWKSFHNRSTNAMAILKLQGFVGMPCMEVESSRVKFAHCERHLSFADDFPAIDDLHAIAYPANRIPGKEAACCNDVRLQCILGFRKEMLFEQLLKDRFELFKLFGFER